MGDDHTCSPSPPIESANAPTLFQLEEDFIILLETLPELWNPRHKYYTNKYKRQAGYEKLLDVYKKIKPQATVEDVRKKINSLRSNFRRELKKIALSKRSGAGVDDLYTPRTKTFKQLGFLYTTETPNYIQQDENSGEISARHESGQETITENPSPGKFSSIAEIVHPPKHKQKPKTLLTKQNELLDRANIFLSQKTSVESTTTTNTLALVWAEKLDKLQPQQRFFAEKAIHDILFEAGLGNLHRFSVKINEPTHRNAMSPYSYNASPLHLHNSPIPHYSSPENPPSPSDLHYSSVTSPTHSSLQSSTVDVPHTSTFEQSQVFAEATVSRTHHSSSTTSTPTHSLTIVPQPMSSQLKLGINSHPGASTYRKGFASQIIIHQNTDVPTLHIPDTQSDIEDYTVGSLFARYNPND
ncbi:unnamed protein product [Parnassius mnemosyne]|uniref:MADF domain-containing protein n=1 Tax=Parnassius mnemosyne TaxID=213953 RepID=A0AAV1L7R5_9NEOP